MKPIESAFQSALAPWLRDFVLEKRAVGYRYDIEQRLLQRIDRLIVEHGHHEATLPRTVLEAWMAKTAHERPTTHVARISVVRQFARFLQRQGMLVEMPPSPPRSLVCTGFRARIFSSDEISRLFVALDQISPHVLAPHRHRAMPALFRVLYGCGLRLGEALHLRVRDIDLVAGVLTIHQGKFRTVSWSGAVLGTTAAALGCWPWRCHYGEEPAPWWVATSPCHRPAAPCDFGSPDAPIVGNIARLRRAAEVSG